MLLEESVWRGEKSRREGGEKCLSNWNVGTKLLLCGGGDSVFISRFVTLNTIGIVAWCGEAASMYVRLESVPWVLMLQPSEAGLEAWAMALLKQYSSTAYNKCQWMGTLMFVELRGAALAGTVCCAIANNIISINTFITWSLYCIVLTLPFHWKISLMKVMTNV